MFIIIRKVNEKFTAKIGKTEIHFTIKKVRGAKGDEKVEIVADVPSGATIILDKKNKD